MKTSSDKAHMYMLPEAFVKMYLLVNAFSTEVQWHGLVTRKDKTTFILENIITFPHTVSCGSVDTDQAEYTEWLNSLDQQTFDKLRLHGHSHVNMSSHPSAIDRKYREDKIGNLPKPLEGDDYFYLFAILNKKGELNLQIFDITNDVIYEDENICKNIILSDGNMLFEFIHKTKDNAKQSGYYSCMGCRTASEGEE